MNKRFKKYQTQINTYKIIIVHLKIKKNVNFYYKTNSKYFSVLRQ